MSTIFGRYFGRDRFLCDVIEEMRVCVKTLNFGNLLGLIEELQCMANRMESALELKNTLNEMDVTYEKKRKELVDLERCYNDIKEKLGE